MKVRIIESRLLRREIQASSIARTHSATLAPLFIAPWTALYSLSYFLSRVHASYTAILCMNSARQCSAPDKTLRKQGSPVMLYNPEVPISCTACTHYSKAYPPLPLLGSVPQSAGHCGSLPCSIFAENTQTLHTSLVLSSHSDWRADCFGNQLHMTRSKVSHRPISTTSPGVTGL